MEGAGKDRIFVCPSGGEPPSVVYVSAKSNVRVAIAAGLFVLAMAAILQALAGSESFLWYATTAGFFSLAL